MTEIIESSDSEEETHPTSFVPTFTHIQNLLEVQDFFAKIRAQSSLKSQGERQITPKMRGKLLGWLEKLSLNTLKFHRSTFINSILILDQYLEKSDDSPSQLQLLGCTSLMIASKYNEEVIVAPDCYCAASCNIFNKKQLLEKERQVYLQIDWKKIRFGSLRAVRVGCNLLKMQEHLTRAQEILSLLLKDERTFLWKDSKLIYSVLSFTRMDVTSNEDVLSFAKQL